ncbi:asparagine synthase-related protein [Limnospira fusiformis]|uniref:asparagine synthase-related protein n=1 Tax=Limnospira fusiformis TaxID=54297 RepID=UPI001449AB69|nr:hypothetical protein HFV01_21840 [Limnospira fusiformis SAG 85.79]
MGIEMSDSSKKNGKLISLRSLSLLFSSASLSEAFIPQSLLVGEQKHWQCPKPTFSGASIEDLQIAFRDSIARAVGDNQKVAVAVSGGIDSCAVLKEVSKLCSNEKQCFAIVGNLRDDANVDCLDVASQLIKNLNIKCTIVSVEEHEASREVMWHPSGPNLCAIPLMTRAIAERAIDCGAEILLTGEGADGLFGAPKYLLPITLGKLKLRKSGTLFRDIYSVGWKPLALELLSGISLLLPKKLQTQIYWSTNLPESCSVYVPEIINPKLHPYIQDWTSRWIAERVNFHLGNTSNWAAADAIDAIFPDEPYPPSGSIAEYNPFQDAHVFEVAMSLPLEERYNESFQKAYHRQKAMVVELLGREAVSILPPGKQFFRKAFNRMEDSRPVDSTICEKVGLFVTKPNIPYDESCASILIRHHIRAVETWLKGAIDRGYSVVG